MPLAIAAFANFVRAAALTGKHSDFIVAHQQLVNPETSGISGAATLPTSLRPINGLTGRVVVQRKVDGTSSSDGM